MILTTSTAPPTVSPADFTTDDLAACERADEKTTAAPAVLKLTHAQAGGRLLFMTWNAGGGARKLPEVLDHLGYDVFTIQEAHQEHMMQLDKLDWVLQRGRWIVVRQPNNVQTIAHGGNNKICWHVAEFVVC